MRTAIIGAGISGLVAGYRLARAGHDVTVYEAAESPGGLASGARIGGLNLDRYYHFICPPDAAYLELLDELDLRSHLHWRPTRMGVFRDETYHRFGTPGALLAFSPLPFADRLRFAAATLRAGARESWQDLDVVTARDWLVAEQGERCYEVIWRPLLELKFGDAAPTVSAAWMWARINRVARSRRGPFSRERLGYLEGGSGTLIDALVDGLRAAGGRVRPRTVIEGVSSEAGRVTGVVANGQAEPFDAVLSTVAPPVLADLLCDRHGPYADVLRRIEYRAVASWLIVAKTPVCDDFWLNIADPRIPFPGVITFTHLDPMPGLGGAHVHYVPRYLRADDPTYDAEPDADLRSVLDALDRIRPGFSGDVIDAARFRDRYAQPLQPAGFSRDFASLMDAATPIGGLFRADMSQVYPNDRSIVNAIDYATRAVTSLCAWADGGGAA